MISFMYYDDLDKALNHAKIVEENGKDWIIFEGNVPLERRGGARKVDQS